MDPISEFVYRRHIQFQDTDASGIVHFSRFFVYAEEAEHAMWRAVGLSVDPHAASLGWPRVSASFDFYKPLRFEDEIELHLRVIGRTAKSFEYQAVIFRAGEMAAMGTMSTICVRIIPGEPLRAVDIPEAIASRFAVTTRLDPPAFHTKRTTEAKNPSFTN